MILAIIYFAVVILTIAGTWRIFEKAGQPGWGCSYLQPVSLYSGGTKTRLVDCHVFHSSRKHRIYDYDIPRNFNKFWKRCRQHHRNDTPSVHLHSNVRFR